MLLAERPALPRSVRAHGSSRRRRNYIRSFPPRYNLRHQDFRGFPEVLSNPPSPTSQPVDPPTQQPVRLTGSLASIFKDPEDDVGSEFILPSTPDKSVVIDLGELSRSGEEKIYEKYYKSAFASTDQSTTVKTFPTQSTPRPLSPLRTVKLLETEDLYLELPRGCPDISLIQKAAKLVADHFRETKFKVIYDEGYKEAINQMLDVCNFPVPRPANICQVDSQPSVHRIFQNVLKSMANIADETGKAQTTVWIRVPYKELECWCYSLKRAEYRITLGYIEDTPVVLVAIGRVQCQGERENDITGYCIINKPGTEPVKGFVLGEILGTGTAVIVDENEQMLVYYPFNAIDPKWEPMRNDSIATLQLADDGRSLYINPIYHQDDVKVDIIPPEDDGDYLARESDYESEEEEEQDM